MPHLWPQLDVRVRECLADAVTVDRWHQAVALAPHGEYRPAVIEASMVERLTGASSMDHRPRPLAGTVDQRPATATLTVTDALGLTGSSTTKVTVNNINPSNVKMALSASSINENGSVTLSGSFTDPATLDTHQVTVNWGDGSANSVVNLVAGVLTFSGISSPRAVATAPPSEWPTSVNRSMPSASMPSATSRA